MDFAREDECRSSCVSGFMGLRHDGNVEITELGER